MDKIIRSHRISVAPFDIVSEVKRVGFTIAREIPRLGNGRLRLAKTVEMQETVEESVTNTALQLAGDHCGINGFRLGTIKYHKVGALIGCATTGRKKENEKSCGTKQTAAGSIDVCFFRMQKRSMSG